MMISKRDLVLGAAACALGVGQARAAEALYAPGDPTWRRYEVTTRVNVPAAGAPVQVWAPLQSVDNRVWARDLGERWHAPGAQARVVTVDGARMLHASWPAGAPQTQLDLTSRFASRDRATPSASGAHLSAAERRLYTAGTRYLPTDGLVRETVTPIVAGIDGDLPRARAIYQWMVEHTFRDGAVRGCGTGDVNAMLESGRLGGKCADLNALFVAMCRSAGIPARDIYGVRVGPSRFGYHSLGPSTPVVTKAQHCRAEAFIDGMGWVAMDPADVRKVMLEEAPGGLAADDAKVIAARQALFGASEGNWLPYNSAHDVALPGSTGEALPFLMYTQVEVGGVRKDCLNPDGLECVIEARAI